MPNIKKRYLIDNPFLLSEWDTEKNAISPDQAPYNCNDNAFWICSTCGHHWTARISTRCYYGHGCPECAKKKRGLARKAFFAQKNNFARLFPDIAEEWHPTKNGDQKPEDFSAYSNTSAYWLCRDCGTEWQTTIHHRTREGNSCPKCARTLRGLRKTATAALANNFAEKYPDLIAQWHPTKNGDLRPEDVSVSSNKRVWWKCGTCAYEWPASVSNRAAGHECPKCAKAHQALLLASRVVTDEYNFSALHPLAAAEWHPTKNEPLTPDQVAPHSNQLVWWLCRSCGHEWHASINKRASGRGCPKCAHAFRTSEAEQTIYFYLRQAFPSAVNTWTTSWLQPQDVDIYLPDFNLAIEYDGGPFHNSKRVLPDQKKTQLLADHGISLIRIRESSAAEISDGSYLITVTPNDDKTYLELPIREIFSFIENRYRISAVPDIDFPRDYSAILDQFSQRKHQTSLAFKNPELAKQWHPSKNGSLLPTHVSCGSSQKVWWICEHGHEWPAAISSRVYGAGCPICAGKQVLVGYNDLATTHPHLAMEWDYEKNTLLPSSITAGYTKKVFWRGSCGHSWSAVVQSRARTRVGCPICSNHAVLPGFNDLATKNPLLAAQWHPTKNGTRTPVDVVPGSNAHAWWLCPVCGYEWSSQINSRSAGCGCPCCANKVIVPGVNDFATQYPKLAAQWHPNKNGNLTPSQISVGSGKKIWWQCSSCGHEWRRVIRERIVKNTACPHCKQTP